MTSTSSTSVIRRSVSFRHGDCRSARYNMVKVGFYYTSDDLVVKCCACKSIVTKVTMHLVQPHTAQTVCEMENGAASAASAASSAVRRSNNMGGFVSDTNCTSSSLPATDTTTVVSLGELCTVIDKGKLMKENE